MSEYTHPTYKKTARIMTVVCGLLFCLFSYVYLSVFQKDVLEAFHYTLAHGKTHYVPQNAAVIITLVLLLLQWGTGHFIRLKGGVRTLAYFPSCLLLGVLAAISSDVYHAENPTSWGWWILAALLLYGGVIWGIQRMTAALTEYKVSPLQEANGNLLILFLLCLMSVGLGSQDTLFHHELAVERCIRDRQYSEALRIGEKSLKTSRTLNVLRAYAMSLDNSLGNRLFHYPQPYGVKGLLFDTGSEQTQRYTADSLYHYLGDSPEPSETMMGFLRNSCRQERGTHAMLDYYMSALLLEKNLEEFTTALNEYYAPEDTLPVHYREALLLYQAEHSAYKTQRTDSIMVQRLEEYIRQRSAYTDAVEAENQLRRTYGNTYWWYYHYQ